MVPPHRIELRTDAYKATVIPFNYEGVLIYYYIFFKTECQVFGAQGGTQTHESTDLQSAPLVALVPVHNLAEVDGLEPPNVGIKIRCLTNLAIPQ